VASCAFKEFRYNVLDAKRLLKVHRVLSAGTPGKKGLGHITRSGVVMLCAAWECYHESVIVEAVDHLTRAVRDPNNLPLPVRKHLSAVAKQGPHELKPMELAGDGWRTLYVASATDEVTALNTPKLGKLKALYERYIGIVNIASFWTIGAEPIDDFVSARGEIAHNGRGAPYIGAVALERYIKIIQATASEHDNRLCDELKVTGGGAYQPWRRTA
jgi:hypothetical protein